MAPMPPLVCWRSCWCLCPDLGTREGLCAVWLGRPGLRCCALQCLLRLLLLVAWPLCSLLRRWEAMLSVLGAKPVCHCGFLGTSHFSLLGKHSVTARMTATGKVTPASHKATSKQQYGKTNCELNILWCVYWVCLPCSTMVAARRWAERIRALWSLWSPPKRQLMARSLDIEQAADKIQFSWESDEISMNSREQNFSSGRKLFLF